MDNRQLHCQILHTGKTSKTELILTHYLLFRINSAVLIKVLEVCGLCISDTKETGTSPEIFFQNF